ncbi:uncharacterized protein N7511_009493 [Penicillium nucicola]|uniref:uncharacterized protein n=1 Tax=Penicillium nucicola TaxID=1850975 RepID=UPI0025454910|nr:uncharacterized protein N7511_009493 [Penicillium nucicola]KAJ5747797.1 hypothetical protein N7511_009493 [Penicillium nucicola]
MLTLTPTHVRAEAMVTQKDYWDSETYAAAASFASHFADTLVERIEFKPTDRVLDIGCGDGIFTSRFAPRVGYVLGVDSSPSMIESAKKMDYGSTSTEFHVVDCRYLNKDPKIMNGNWDKVASNAAFHWILRDKITRISTLKAIFKSMKPGGVFFFEMCGHGNAAEKMTAFMFALVNQGVPIEKVEAACPWFYPSDAYMKEALESVGFEIKTIGLKSEAHPVASAGMEGFMRLIGAQMLDLLDTEEQKDKVIEQIVRMTRYGTTREDGTQWISYTGLRCIAVKP